MSSDDKDDDVDGDKDDNGDADNDDDNDDDFYVLSYIGITLRDLVHAIPYYAI